MAAFISRKMSLLILLTGLAVAAGAVFLLNYLLAGPRLGLFYDLLLDRRPAPPVSRDILLIDTGDLVEPGDVLPLLLTLAEMDASGLVIQVPVLGLLSGRNESEEEIRRRLDDEFRLLGRNIRNLFEAIRVGSVPPAETEQYVESLVELGERGKERLGSALVRRDGEGALLFDRALRAFGPVWIAGDLRTPQGLVSLPMDSPWYSKPRPDGDGKIRRISPVLPPGTAVGTERAAALEHVVYAGLKSRWNSPEKAGERLSLPDREGEILVEGVRVGEGFRRLPLNRFREYEEADRLLAEKLKDAEAFGFSSEIQPERSPLLIYEYARSLREELLESPGPEKKAAWAAGRAEYFTALEELLYGPVETALVNGYEELIATENLKDEGRKRLRELRDELIRTFLGLREQYQKVLELRRSLESALASSFCIMGPPVETGPSALLANTLLTGRFIKPAGASSMLFWSLPAAFLTVFIIFALGSFRALWAGSFLSLLIAAGFSWSFIISGYWIDPQIPAGAALAGTLAVFIFSFLLIRRGSRRFRLAYGLHVNASCLKSLIRVGRPQPSETLRARAAIVAIRSGGLPVLEDREDSLTSARSLKIFQKKAAEVFKKAGAVIIGMDGDLVLAAFGSPLERIVQEKSKTGPLYNDDPLNRRAYNPAVRAAGIIAGLIRENREAASWYFGIDTGKCAFFWSGLPGYTACGRPVIRARILSNLAPRYKVKVIITESVSAAIQDIPARKLNALSAGGKKEYFYELLINSPRAEEQEKPLTTGKTRTD
jgi:class 3 adenylate cyclase